MPNYIRNHGKLSNPRVFNSIDSMSHFLTKATDDNWSHFQAVAKDMLLKKKKPRRQLKKKTLHDIATKPAYHLLAELHHEVQKYYDQEDIGGGIIETIGVLGEEVKHLLGFDYLQKLIGYTPSTVPLTLNSEQIAYLVDQTYSKEEDRKDHTIGYTRLTQYDSDLCSVYQKDSDSSLLVTVRGTSLKNNWDDVGYDLQILAGQQIDSKELESLLTRIESDYPESKYDIASHSLGTMYVYSAMEEHKEHMNEIYMYNAASSPLMDTEKLQEYANQDIHFYLNQGDIVSQGVYQQMNDQTYHENLSIGPYRHLPLSAHDLTQWYDQDVAISDDHIKMKTYEGTEDLQLGAEMQQDTVETRKANLS